MVFWNHYGFFFETVYILPMGPETRFEIEFGEKHSNIVILLSD